MAGKFYAVRNGKIPGIYTSWEECKSQVDGFSNAEYKSFKSMVDAQNYMGLEEKKCELSLPKGVMAAYVDGSYMDSIPAFSYGMIAFTADETIRDCMMYTDEDLISMRNVAGEIKGAEMAMRLAIEKGCDILHIYHDYEGIAAWCEGRWKTNKTGTIRYKEFYDSIIKEKLSVIFHKVKGHSGDRYNEEADKLAASAFEQ